MSILPCIQLFFLLCFGLYSSVEAQEATVVENIRYGDRPTDTLITASSDRLLDLYMPKDSPKRLLPVFVFVHGGGFAMGDKESTKDLCTAIAKRGFAVVSINYRLYLSMQAGRSHWSVFSKVNSMANGLPPNGKVHLALQKGVEVASEDLLLAIEWVKHRAEQYGLGAKSLIRSGSTAGAMTVLHTAHVAPPAHLRVKAVVNLWGSVQNTSAIQAYENMPALLTYHGYQDKIIHVDYAYALQKRMLELGNTHAEIHILNVKGHALN